MKVKCIRQRTKRYLNGRSWERHVTGLTIDKIYEVLDTAHIAGEPVYYIMKDSGFTDESVVMYMQDADGIWFEDADAEVRDNKINQIIK
jgi:hypothetical protein